MKSVSCPICNRSALLRNSEQIGYQKPKKYAVYHCVDGCETAFVRPLKVDEEIYNAIYSKGDAVPGYARYFLYAQKVLQVDNPLKYLVEAEDVYWGIDQFLKRKKQKNPKILEVGCGLGYLTYALSKAGHSVKGIDISKVAIEEAQKKYGHSLFECIDLLELSKRQKASYHVVIFTEVIEHIENVKEFMQAVVQLLLPGGSIFLTTPNKTPYPSDVLWETEPPPVHLFWFTENAMRFLAKTLKCSVDFIDFSLFNYLEYCKKGDYSKAEISIRNFQPSRLPRLDEKGDVLKDLPNTLHTSFTELPKGFTLDAPASPPQLPLKRSFAEKILRKIARWTTKCLGIYSYLKKNEEKKKIEKEQSQERERILNLFPKNRPTMCAIFNKPKKMPWVLFDKF